MLPPGSRTNPAHSSENPSPSLPPSHQPISVSKHKCLSRHSSTRKSLWSPGAEKASKQPPSSQLPPPPFSGGGGRKSKQQKKRQLGSHWPETTILVTICRRFLHPPSQAVLLRAQLSAIAAGAAKNRRLFISKHLQNRLQAALPVKTKLFCSSAVQVRSARGVSNPAVQ